MRVGFLGLERGGRIAILPACQEPVKCDTPGVTITPSSVDLAKQHSTHFTQLTLERSLIGWLVVICISVFAMLEKTTNITNWINTKWSKNLQCGYAWQVYCIGPNGKRLKTNLCFNLIGCHWIVGFWHTFKGLFVYSLSPWGHYSWTWFLPDWIVLCNVLSYHIIPWMMPSLQHKKQRIQWRL